MLYLVHKHTKEHRRYADALDWPDADCMVVEGDPDGWIEWHDGECPLPEGFRCDVIHRSGFSSLNRPAGGWAWGRDYEGDDIIAYRPILDAGEPEPPAWDGKGLPPVGCECVYLGNKERQGEITHHTRYAAVIEYPNGGYDVGGPACFRPIRSEEDGAVDAMVAIAEHEIEKDGSVANSTQIERCLDAVYAAIRDGKVPGVKLTGGE